MITARTIRNCALLGLAWVATGCAQTNTAATPNNDLAEILGAQASDRVGVVDDFSVSADLDGDGIAETVRLAWLSGGGSGTYDSLVVSGAYSDAYKYAAPLGDRVQVRSAVADGNTIIVDTLQAGPDDAMCCAGQKFRRTFALADGQLQEVATIDGGRISTADLAGEWQLVSMKANESLPGGISITLALDGNRLSGSSGCNRYMGLIAPGEPPRGIKTAGPLAGTKMACPPPVDAIEREYLGKLDRLYQYGFLAGKLVISWGDDTERGLLTYTRAD